MQSRGAFGAPWIVSLRKEPGLAGEPWAYCAPKIDYSAVRSTVGVAFAAKGAELHHAIAAVQQLTKAAAGELKLFQERCH